MEIPCDSSQLILQRNKVLIVPSAALTDATTYFFEIETGAFQDKAENEVMRRRGLDTEFQIELN